MRTSQDGIGEKEGRGGGGTKGGSRHPSPLTAHSKCVLCLAPWSTRKHFNEYILYVWDDTWKINCYCFARVRLCVCSSLVVFFVVVVFIVCGCSRWSQTHLLFLSLVLLSPNIIVNEYIRFWIALRRKALHRSFRRRPRMFGADLAFAIRTRHGLIIIYYWYACFVC